MPNESSFFGGGKPVRLIGIDPGVSTGWATGTLQNGSLAIDKDGWDPWRVFAMRFHDRMLNFEEEGFDVVVVEDWRLTKKGKDVLVGSDLPSSQVLGCTRLGYDLARRAGHHPRLVLQQPSTKAVVNGWMGAVVGWLPESPVDHNRDAIRHLWYYALNPANETGVKRPDADEPH